MDKKYDLAPISWGGRIKCPDTNITWKLKQFVGTFPSVKLVIDSSITTGWIWKTSEVIFTLSGPRVDVKFCMESIESSIKKYIKRISQ
jgi:hypothetical protein